MFAGDFAKIIALEWRKLWFVGAEMGKSKILYFIRLFLNFQCIMVFN